MSAIAGEISYEGGLNKRVEEFEEMKKRLSHRGPDEQASYITSCTAFIQNLLCTENKGVELLPYLDKIYSKKYLILLDGCLINRDEITEQLAKKGCNAKGDNDFELILKGYVHFGKEILNIINGVYAFVIWDFEKEELFFARDRLGVKPLFYSVKNGNFIFASEIKGMLESSEIKPEIDIQSVMELMLIGPGRTLGYGVFKDIYELKPAHCGIFSKNGLSIERYWDLKAKKHTDSFETTVEKVRYLVIDSVERQLESDFPICTMLSGGLDSSIITALANKVLNQHSQRLKCFSVSYKDQEKYFKKNRFQPDSDGKYIAMMREKFNLDNEIIELDSQQLFNALYNAVDARDLPGMADIDSSLLLFLKQIRNEYKIALSGECSDELFGGYPWYRDPKLDNPNGFPWAHSDILRKSLINPELLEGFDTEEFVYKKYIETVNSASKLEVEDKDFRKKELMKLNIDWFMMTLVDRTDRMCSLAGVDVRVPFCDYRIAEYLYNIPWEYKDYKGYEKGLLREAFGDYLPEEVLWRKKSPYPKTHNPEYLGIVRKELKKIIEDGSPMFEFVNMQNLSRLLDEKVPQNFYGQLMTTAQTVAYFIQLDYWLKKYDINIDI